eukprot:CAMPEP_0178453018 /NCGR_PEP_ID=MMETSP0689_2-20121128/44570_1 /TAXON_ID=160604 /ORGANISM="Amphidinium massartii, Strain CS-259" /LENGTH=220 /DNA_ID=CAMNT_0020078795 /DNA_START=45 /DNA_END=704 /DNA_ORIENTATION=-
MRNLSGVLARHGVPASSTQRDMSQRVAVPSQADLDHQDAVVEGLAEWLHMLSLESYLPEVAEWAQQMGAALLEEVVENIEDLCTAVPFKRLESKRLSQHGVEAAHMLLFGEAGSDAPPPMGPEPESHAEHSVWQTSGGSDVWSSPPPAPSPVHDEHVGPTVQASSSITAAAVGLKGKGKGKGAIANTPPPSDERPKPITSRGAPRPLVPKAVAQPPSDAK